MSVSHSAENPGTVQLIPIMFRIQYPVQRGIDGIHLRILSMEMVQSPGLSKLTDTCTGIHSLPNQMAGIKIGPDFRSDSFPETQQSFRVINTEARMQLQCDFVNPMLSGKCCFFLPVRDQNLIPLIFQNL